MAGPAHQENTELLATARWLQIFDKLTVEAMRRCYPHASTDRLAAACRAVKAEARERQREGRELGIVPDAAARPARGARTINAPRRPTHRGHTVPAAHCRNRPGGARVPRLTRGIGCTITRRDRTAPSPQRSKSSRSGSTRSGSMWWPRCSLPCMRAWKDWSVRLPQSFVHRRRYPSRPTRHHRQPAFASSTPFAGSALVWRLWCARSCDSAGHAFEPQCSKPRPTGCCSWRESLTRPWRARVAAVFADQSHCSRRTYDTQPTMWSRLIVPPHQ